MKILVTGGAGFIGSHTVVELLNNNYEVVVIDNFFNSNRDVLDKIKTITNKDFKFYEGNVCDKEILTNIFKENSIDAVIHFAGYKAVGESVKKPLMYYRNNIDSTLSLCEVMNKFNCKKIVFSSSATVYGNPKTLPIKEDFPLSTTNPYGTTKLYIEGILRDLCISDNNWSIALLRYFNPIGAHESGLIGESPNDIPNNLMPYIVKVANKQLPYLSIFGNDYDTVDGTGVRDYIHVVDLAKGHIKAIEKVLKDKGVDAYNLGTGTGYSVLQLVNTFSKINNIEVPYKVVERRTGDIASCYADIAYAKEKLGWEAKKDIDMMCKDAWNFANKSLDKETNEELEDNDAKEILKVIEKYSKALNLLDDYDHRTLKKISGNKSNLEINYADCIEIISKLKFNETSNLFALERNKGLEAIIGDLYQTYDGKYLYKSLEEKAANLLYMIVKNHVFIDGNKRIAATIFIYFLQFYNLLYKEDKQTIDNNTLTALTLLIAESNPKEKDIIVDLILNFLN